MTPGRDKEKEDPAHKGGRIGGHLGGEKGGKVSANQTTSADLAKSLSGIRFPSSKNDIVKIAQQNIGKVEAPDSVTVILKQLPDRQYISVKI